ncbi:branched-chain amino acid ABC transporter permease, partial [bacterium]|nr:branched-chain amino acid ABC transporter permease [bacterium]
WVEDLTRAVPLALEVFPQPLRSLFSAHTYPFFYLAIVLVCLVATYIIINTLTQSPFGRVIKSIREGDNLPQALGKDVKEISYEGNGCRRLVLGV